jgi:hypothetical protein
MIDLIHSLGPGACGATVARYTERPVRGEPVDASKVRLLDGTTPDPGDIMVCGTCGMRLDVRAIVPLGGWA